MCSWKAGRPKNLIETSLWQAWVAWIERGQQIWVQKIHRQKIIRNHHWLPTQWFTLAACWLSDVCLSWMSLQKGIAGMDSLDKHVEQISVGQWVTFSEHGQLKGWQPHFQPTMAKTRSRQWSIGLQQWLRQPRSQSTACNPKLVYHNSIFCKHDATDATIMQSWWSVLPLSGTSSFW